MASGFVGYAVLVTLSSPTNAQLRGTVANIVGQRLTLHDVTLWNGQRSPSYTIDAAIIADLEVSSTHSQTASQTVNRIHPVVATSIPDITHQRLSQDHSQVPARPQPEPFVDPAILSFSTASTRTTTKQTPVAALISRSDSFLGSPSSVLSVETARPSQPTEKHDSAVTATLTEPFSNITLDKTKIDGEHESTLHPIQGHLKKNGKRGGRNKRQDHAGHGWRQTAFVEPARPRLHTGYPADETPIVSAHTRQHKNKNRNNYAENSNGWATEDATDIQELGDFDFEGNLSKFDKRRVFDEIRNDDTTADEDRLVSFNKRPRPGTNGGKNLHWSENVLDNTPAQWNSEAGETETESSDDKFSSGNYSNRDKSKPSGRSQMTKKAAVNNSQLATNASLGSTGRNSIPSPRNISPMPHRQSGRTSPLNGANNVTSSGTLRLTTTNRLCPTVSPLQMLEIEQLAVTELGLTEDMIVENAGRGIAEAAVGRLGSEAAAPSVLVFTGNHRTGGRAIAAARHLKNRGHRVTLCLLGLEHETELVENCRKQLEIFKKIGGRVLRWEQLSTRLLTPDFSVDLVIDALFGMHIAFEDLRSDDQAAACEMIAWINRSKLVVVSVDIPAGISAATGDVGVVQGSRLSIISDSVVCLAAPKTGVVNALDSGEGSSWKVTVADIGISQVVWRKYGTRRRHGVDFGNRWVVSLKYQPAAT